MLANEEIECSAVGGNEGITPEASSLRHAIDLLYSWTGRQVRARYQQSVLGWLWAVVQPSAQVAIFALIFTRVVPIDTPGVPYVLFCYVAIAPWTFLSTGITDMTNSVVENMTLVSKIYFRREVLPLSAMFARLLDFLVCSCLTILLIMYYRIPVRPGRMVLIALMVVVQMCLMAGIGMACAAANTFVRDVRPLVALVLQVWFYASPIIYPLERIPAQLRIYYAMNPAVGLIEGYRAAWLNTAVPILEITFASIAASAILLGGWWFFKRTEAEFADII